MSIVIKKVCESDFDVWEKMRGDLYSMRDTHFHQTEMKWFSQSQDKQCLMAHDDERKEIIGLIEISLRNLVDGCLTSPVGYIEGIYVVAEYRKQGIARQLLECAESWFREKGCKEMALDAELKDTEAQKFHEHMGFQETYRIVEYKKNL